MAADYSDFPPEGVTPSADEYTVTIDGVGFPTPQIIDDEDAIFFVVDPMVAEGFRPIAYGEKVQIETPIESFTGKVELIALEHGELSIRVGRRGVERDV